MQQEVLSELYNYVTQDPLPVDYESVKATLCYLEACNKIFEKGLLSHHKVCDPNNKVIGSIKEGFAFFTEWHAGLSRDGNLFVCFKCVMFIVYGISCR